MSVQLPSPAIAIVGRHNSGKTTLIEKLIAELTARGFDVGSIKHHSHADFSIDYPGKDSYRHRAAGATETIISAPGQVACVKTIQGERECSELLRDMPGHDIVIVEGYRKSGLPTIEIMRSGNDADMKTARVFAQGARDRWPLGVDFAQVAKAVERGEDVEIPIDEKPPGTEETDRIDYGDISNKMPTAKTVAVVTDIDEALEAAESYGIASFALGDIASLADYVEEHHVRPRLSIVIQAGGESRRMGQSKATVPFAGRPLISRLVDRIGPVADELTITTNEPENLAFLEEEHPELTIKLIRDEYDYRGALPGIYTALKNASHPHVAIVACDMVFASPSLIVAEAITMKEQGVDVVVPVNKHGFEPFHATYHRERCLPAIERALDRDEKKAQSFFDDVVVYKFTQAQVLEVEPMGGCFINANTPEELAAIEHNFLEG